MALSWAPRGLIPKIACGKQLGLDSIVGMGNTTSSMPTPSGLPLRPPPPPWDQQEFLHHRWHPVPEGGIHHHWEESVFRWFRHAAFYHMPWIEMVLMVLGCAAMMFGVVFGVIYFYLYFIIDGNALTKEDVGKSIEIKGDIVTINGVVRKVDWDGEKRCDLKGVIKTVKTGYKGRVTLTDGRTFQNPSGVDETDADEKAEGGGQAAEGDEASHEQEMAMMMMSMGGSSMMGGPMISPMTMGGLVERRNKRTDGPTHDD